jgi:GntR family transcriptional regulator/MocR family aminotransferase
LIERRFYRAVSAYLSKMGVTARALSPHFIGGIAEHGLFLGFAAWNEREIDAGADIIGDVMRRWPAS